MVDHQLWRNRSPIVHDGEWSGSPVQEPTSMQKSEEASETRGFWKPSGKDKSKDVPELVSHHITGQMFTMFKAKWASIWMAPVFHIIYLELYWTHLNSHWITALDPVGLCWYVWCLQLFYFNCCTCFLNLSQPNHFETWLRQIEKNWDYSFDFKKSILNLPFERPFLRWHQRS